MKISDQAEVAPEVLNILVARPDRMGDVILSSPVFEVLKKHYPKSRITALVRAEVAPLVQGLDSVDEVLTFDPFGAHHGIKGWIRLFKEIRARKFRIAVVLQSRFRIASAIALAGIRYRVGPRSKIHSFFFFNKAIRQQRSHVEMHEADYNLQLLRKLGISVASRAVLTKVELPVSAKDKAKAWLKEQGHDPFTDKQAKLIGVHPGMGGSALNWPEEHYLDLVRKLIQEKFDVLLTVGEGEAEIAKRIQEGVQNLGVEEKGRLIIYQGKRGKLEELGAVMSFCKVVVAPSTGPLHLAVALGVRVVTFYPPIRVQSAIRWGPYVNDDKHASVLVPDVYCGEDFHCRGNLCNYYPCMKSIKPSQAFEEISRQLKEEITAKGASDEA